MVMAFSDNLIKQKHSFATYSISMLCVIGTVFTPYASIFGFVPLNFSLYPAIFSYSLITAQFLHGGETHLVGNLLFLMAFGRSIENLLGPIKFASALVGLGAFAFLGSWILRPASPIPIIGISGSLSFLLGTYTVVFPRAKLRIIPFLRVPWMRAWVFSCLWLGLQVRDMFVIGEDGAGIAYPTHIGGFIIGLVAGVAWKELALDTDRLIAEVYKEDQR